MDGALVVNKDRGMTSHDAVQKVRRFVKSRSVGHLGTLDPIATGVLPLLVGRATRLQRFYTARRKRYEGRIRFGFATDTYDADGQPVGPDRSPHLSLEELGPHVAALTGKMQQTPPSYSAKKVRGVAAYELARRREKFTLNPVEVEVYRFELKSVEGPYADFVIECSSGTYIRSLAHDLGQRVGVGAHLVEICRTASGEFTLDQAWTLDALGAAAGEERLPQVVIPLAELLPDLPRVAVGSVLERKVLHGGKIELSPSQIEQPTERAPLDGSDGKPFRLRVFNQKHQLIAIAQAVVPRVFRPVVVLPTSPSGAPSARA